MGHTGHIRSEYRDLLTRLDAGQAGMPEPTDPAAWEGWKELLEIMYTPEEAELAVKIPVQPRSLRTIAKRVGMSEAELKPKLDRMADKGLVMDLVSARTGRTKYLLSPPVIGFFEFAFMRAEDMFPKEKIAKAMEAYMHGDPVFATGVFGRETVVGRSMVREEHLADEVLPDVLDWERSIEVIRTAKKLAVSLCYCRHKAEHLGKRCDAPKEICLSLNGGADFIIRRGFGREISNEEGLEVLQRAKKAGLVQIADNVQSNVTYVCNCCACCCGQLRSINDFGLRGVNPSAYLPEFDQDTCKGCSRCSRACPVTAISMAGKRVRAKRKNDLEPRLDEQTCIGCGICAEVCRQSSVSMVARPERPHVPLNAIDRVVRTAMDRGRLSDLLFDEGQSRGAKFLNRTMHALGRLPAAQRLLASEQLRSRFVRQALKIGGDPTS